MKKITFPLTYEYLQEIRMAQAVMESDFTLCVEPWQDNRFKRLKAFFPVKYELIQSDSENVTVISDILVSHKTITPETKIGALSRPLILPHEMLSYCKKLWPKKRKYKYAFIGKINKARKIWLQTFLSSKVKGYTGISGKVFIDYPIFKKLSVIFRNFDKLIVTESLRGREFPGKAWDDEYFRIQSQAEFILCPSGDVGCPWTYRFFEAMLCGAIPIIEAESPCYEPFKFYRAEQNPDSFIYDQEIVDYNFKQCEKYLTIGTKELNSELSKLYDKLNALSDQ